MSVSSNHPTISGPRPHSSRDPIVVWGDVVAWVMGGILISEAALVLVLRGLDALALRAGISPAESRASLAWVSLVADRKTLVESTNFQLLAVAVVGMVFAALLGRRGMWRRAVILALLSIATLLALRGTGPLIDLTLGARPL